MISQGLRPLFWDVDLREVDPSAYPDYAIFRVLEYGDIEAVTWARETFGDDEIRRVLREERRCLASLLLFGRSFMASRASRSQP